MVLPLIFLLGGGLLGGFAGWHYLRNIRPRLPYWYYANYYPYNLGFPFFSSGLYRRPFNLYTGRGNDWDSRRGWGSGFGNDGRHDDDHMGRTPHNIT